jgi:hypothetical protein
VGEVSDARFKFMRVIHGRNSFLPVITGEVVDTATGVELTATFRLHWLVAVFMVLWMCAPTCLEVAAANGIDHATPGVSFAVPLSFSLFGYVLTMACFVPEKKTAKRMIAKLLDAAEEN